jgi:hypothetical protein
VLSPKKEAAKRHAVALTLHQKKAVTKKQAKRYAKARKKEKRRIFDQHTALTGYNRSYAAWRLRQAAKPGKIVKKKPPPPRAKKYGPQEFKALRKIWAILSMPLGKRPASSREENRSSAGKMPGT